MSVSTHVQCPVCRGRGSCKDRRLHPYRCGLCQGAGTVSDALLQPIEFLRAHVMRVVDAIQGGREDDAAVEAQIVFRLARDIAP